MATGSPVASAAVADERTRDGGRGSNTSSSSFNGSSRQQQQTQPLHRRLDREEENEEREATTPRASAFRPVTTYQSDASQVHGRHRSEYIWRQLQFSNAVQRILSSLVLAPLITYFLWRSPAFATTTVCAVVAAVSCYEYSWLAHRIHQRVGGKFEKFEQKFGVCEPLRDSHDQLNEQVARDCNHGSNTSRLSSHSMNDPSSNCIRNPQPRTNTGYNNRRTFDSSCSIQEEIIGWRDKDCAITPLGHWCCFGSEWSAAVVTSLIGMTFLTLIYTGILATGISVTKDFAEFQVYYAAISSFAACLCASFTPNWRYAVLLILQVLIFSALTVYSMKCPINNFTCDDVVHPMNFVVGGIFLIVVFRVHTSKSQSDLLLGIVLDLTGFIYVIGSLFLIVSFVDIDREATYRKLLIALLYVVWASDSGAYLLGKIFECCEYTHRHPLASHLSMNKDYEGTIGAIIFGVCAMFVASDLLEIPGSVAEKLIFSTFAVIVGRIGDLFESLLKRAALVKDSGTLIPGHGGVLDRIDALMFAAIVFSRYFDAIIFPEEG